MSQWLTIRRKAAELLKEYELKAQQEGLPPAFSSTAGPHAVLSEIARHCLGFSVMTDPALPTRVWGSINHDEDTISINPSLQGAKKLFVTAHEIGHATLGHPPRPFLEPSLPSNRFHSWDSREDIDPEPNAAALLESDGAIRRYSTRANVELQANVFAAELLAPLHQVRAWVESHGCDVGKMMAYFGVSKGTLKNQLMAAYCGAVLCESKEQRPLPPVDDAQQKAATVPGSALILAGPGAGKTRALTARFVHLIEDKGILPNQILLLTYSHKAAEEMRTRLSSAMPRVGHEINVGTFHSLGQQLLLDYWKEAGFTREPALLTDADAFVFLRSRLGELPLQIYADTLEPTRNLRALLDAIGRLKDELIGPNQFRSQVEKWGAKGRNKEKALELAAVYECYQQWLRMENYVDYGDLIMEAVRLFENDVVAWKIHDDYQHVLVDEFQDVNRASGQLMQHLDGERGVTWAVADPRQSIYAFRGASRANVEEFTSHFVGAQILELSTNYRSVEDIVCAGNAITFGSNPLEPDPFHPKLEAKEPYAPIPAVTAAVAPDADSEIAGIVRTVQELCGLGYLPHQIAILCRRREMAQRVSLALESVHISTDWAGAMHEQAAFKDMMAVLHLACNHPHALPRMLRHPAHRLSDADLDIALAMLRTKRGSSRATLRALAKDEDNGLSDGGRAILRQLRGISIRAARRPSAHNVLSAYLWEETEWFLARCRDLSPSGRRYVATVGQLVDLAREFSSKGRVSLHARTPEFVDYVRSCLETGRLKNSHELIAIPDAVTITTIHGSKGLEWPAVIVPGCVEMLPPRSSIVYPPELTNTLTSGNDTKSRACLAYVAITRARERLILSRVERADVLIEPAFAEVIASLQADSLLNVQEWPPVVMPTPDGQPWGEFEGDDLVDGDVVSFDLEILESVQFCGQKAKYIHVDGFRAESTGYQLFRRILNEAFGWLVEQHNVGNATPTEKIEEHLDQLWEDAEPQERQLGQFYRKRAVAYSLLFAQRLIHCEYVRWKAPLKSTSGLPGVKLQFEIDECERRENGQRPILRWHSFHSELPPVAKLKTRLRLALCSRQRILGLEPLVRVYHVPTGAETTISFQSEEWGEAKAELRRLYKLWHTQQLSSNVSYNCASCTFNFLCPT